MRLYVHTHNVTYIWKGTGSENLESLLSDFVKAAADFTGFTDPGALQASRQSGKALAASEPVNKFFQDRDDVSVVVGTPQLKVDAKAPAAKPKTAVVKAAASGSRVTGLGIEGESLGVIKHLLSNAAIAVQNKNFAQVRLLTFQRIRGAVPRSTV